MIYRIFVEKKDDLQAKKTAEDIKNLLKIKVEDVRRCIRYDVENRSSARPFPRYFRSLPWTTFISKR